MVSSSMSAVLSLDNSGDMRSWVISAAAGVATYVATSQGLFLTGGRWQLPLFVGLVVGLVSLIPWQGAVVSVVCILGGLSLAPPFAPFGAKPIASDYILGVLLALIGGAVPSLVRSVVGSANRKRVTIVMSAAIVAWIIVGLWSPLGAEGWPPKAFGPVSASLVRNPPAVGSYSKDDELYRHVFIRMHQGQPYYAAFRAAWDAELQRPAPPNSPFGIRLPTYFWLWRMLPPDPFATIYLFLAFATVGVVASAFIAAQLVGPRLAPLSAVTFAAYALAVGISPTVFSVDLPAMSLALVGVAMFLASVRGSRAGLLWGAVAALVAAALTREVLVYLLMLAACSAFLAQPGERVRAAIPWLVGICVFTAGYALHTAAAWTYLQLGSTSVTYARGGFAYMFDGMTRFSDRMLGGGPSLLVLVILGLLGAVASRRRVGNAFAGFAVAAIVVPFVVMLWVGNSAMDRSGNVVNYWGTMVVPLALSLWPASALILTRRSAE